MAELQLSRVQQIWLMSALLWACVPIWYFLPLWAPIGGLLVISFRAYLLHKGRSQPGTWTMSLLAVLLAVAFVAQFGITPGVEPMSTILTVASCLYLLEMSRQRQSHLLIYLCLFMTALQPIFAQNMGSFFLSLISFTIILTAQSMLLRATDQQFSLFNFSLEPLRQVLRLVAVSIPLTIIIFVLAPRLPAFSVLPVQIDQATTGVSDFMDPGSISSLGSSNEVAFRVDFEGNVPAPRDLYWRGLVFSDFDGRSWQPKNENRRMRDGAAIIWPDRQTSYDWRREIEHLGEPIRYSVFLEPTHEDWLFALPAATSERVSVGQARNLLLVNRIPVAQSLKYDVESHLEYRHQPSLLIPSQIRENTAYDIGDNPRTEALVAQWVEEGGADSVVQRLLLQFNSNFTYTYEPPTYLEEAVDQFLFDGQRGFCEHFASATAAVLRMAGIPARIVAGYQGGEVHPTEGYLIVHQYNAHAWVEYWQDNIGWTRLDPTSAVAPERIEMGFEQFFRNDDLLDESFFSLERFRGFPLANWVRLQLDSLNYRWLSLVLGYDTGSQFDLLEDLLGEVTPLKLALSIVAALATLVGVYLLVTAIYTNRTLTPEQRIVRLYLTRLRKLGFSPQPGMTLENILAKATEQLPEYRDQLVELTERLDQFLYQLAPQDSEILRRDILQLS